MIGAPIVRASTSAAWLETWWSRERHLEHDLVRRGVGHGSSVMCAAIAVALAAVPQHLQQREADLPLDRVLVCGVVDLRVRAFPVDAAVQQRRVVVAGNAEDRRA